MASRIAYPGTEAALEALTTTNFDRLPGGLIGYAAVTANQTGIGTTLTDLTGLTVTVTANSGRAFWLWAHVNLQCGGGGASSVQGIFRESSTNLGDFALSSSELAGEAQLYDAKILVVAPSSGSHTYKLSAVFNANANNLVVAASTQPCWIGVFDTGITF